MITRSKVGERGQKIKAEKGGGGRRVGLLEPSYRSNY